MKSKGKVPRPVVCRATSHLVRMCDYVSEPHKIIRVSFTQSTRTIRVNACAQSGSLLDEP